MKERDKIEIAIAGDGNYVMPLTVLLKSIFVNNSDVEITVNFLHLVQAITEEELRKIEHFVVQHGHVMRRIAITEEQLGEVPESRHSKSTFLRLFLPDLLPEDIEKVLYLDGDVVVNGSLKALYQLDIKDVYIAGVKDPTIVFSKDFCQEIGMPDDALYFNAGIMLMNITRMREEKTQRAFLEFLRQNSHRLRTDDQDVLNATLYKAVRYISPIYNYNYWTEKDVALQLFTKEEVKAAWKHPVIIHYIGPVKPWNYKSIHPKKSLWWHYLRQTPYKDYRPKDKNLKNCISYFFLRTIVKPIKPLLTVKMKQRAGRLIPNGLKKMIKKSLFKAQ